MTTLPAPAHDAWIQVHSGQTFDLLNPTPEHVNAADIAVALSRQPRFGGHTTRAYSVAQHSLVVQQLLTVTQAAPHVLLQGLLHDATEAYVVDVPRPLKAMLPNYKEIESRVWEAVAAHFGIPAELDPLVKWADEEALMHEARHLLTGGPQGWGRNPLTPTPLLVTRPLTAESACGLFLSRLQSLLKAPPLRKVNCPACAGKGRFEEDDEDTREHAMMTGNAYFIDCEECDGEGLVTQERAQQIVGELA